MDFDINLFKQIRESHEVQEHLGAPRTTEDLIKDYKEAQSNWDGDSLGGEEAINNLAEELESRGVNVEELDKVVEGAETITEPTTKPTTRPGTTPAPSKPQTPVTPQPNIQPKPKALNADVELFMAARESRINEALLNEGTLKAELEFESTDGPKVFPVGTIISTVSSKDAASGEDGVLVTVHDSIAYSKFLPLEQKEQFITE